MQLQALYRAGGRTARSVDEGMFEKMLATMLSFELKLSQYSAALETYDVLKKYPDALEENKQLVAAVSQLRDHIQRNKILAVPGEISANGGLMAGWSYHLLRREFAFDVIRGELQNLALRCDWTAFTDEITLDVAWQIPDSWGKCQLFVNGAVGSTFRLFEYPAEMDSQSRVISPSDSACTVDISSN